MPPVLRVSSSDLLPGILPWASSNRELGLRIEFAPNAAKLFGPHQWLVAYHDAKGKTVLRASGDSIDEAAVRMLHLLFHADEFGMGEWMFVDAQWKAAHPDDPTPWYTRVVYEISAAGLSLNDPPGDRQ